MLHMVFQYGWVPVFIKRKSIGFEAMLENDQSYSIILLTFYIIFFCKIASTLISLLQLFKEFSPSKDTLHVGNMQGSKGKRQWLINFTKVPLNN